MPRLFQINVCNNVFSTGKIVSEIGEAAINSGWESYIAYGRDYIPSPNIDIKIGNKAEQVLHVLETRIFDNAGLGYSSYLATRQLIKKLKIIKPDIIHLHVLSGYYVNIRVLINYLSNLSVPVVWTFHSCWEFTGHCTHFDYERCFKWKIQCYNCPLYREYPQSWFRDNSSNNYLTKKRLFTSLNNVHIVAVSKWLKEQVEESFFKACDVSYIYNGIDVDLFRPLRQQEEIKKKYGLEGKKVLLALSSMWLPKKGLNDYMELAKRLEGYDVIVVLVGYTPEHPNDLPNNIVTMPVTTNRQQLVELYNAADVLLNLSYEESFGLTTVEGLACGTPAIVYNRTASPELVDEYTGIVVEAGEIDSLVKAVNTMLNNGKDFFAEACRKRAVEQFDKNKTYSKYINLYNKLTNVSI